MVVQELMEMGLSELEAKLRELGTAASSVAEADEVRRLRHELQLKEIRLEMQRRELDTARREREQAYSRFANLFSSTPIAYVTLDAHGRLLEFNPAATELLGLESGHALNSLLSDHLADGEEPPLRKHLAQVLGSGQRGELLIQPRDVPPHRFLRLLSEPCRIGQEPACLCAIIESAPPEQLPPYSEDIRHRVFDTLPVQLAVLNSHGMIIAVNEAWGSAAGRSDAPCVVCGSTGDNYLQLHSGTAFAQAPLLVNGIRSVSGGKLREFHLEYANHTAQEKRWFTTWVTPMAGGAGGAVVANVDVSARVLAREAVNKRREVLAQAARRSSVGILASELAHEIAQPLTAVGQFSSTAAAMLDCGDTRPQELAEVLQYIDSEVQRAGNVIRRLKIFMGLGAKPRRLMDVARPVHAALAEVGHKLAEKGIELFLELPDERLAIEADKVQITQVLVNLLHNSIEAIDRAGCVERRIHLHAERKQGWLYVQVRDTGPGIAQEWHKSIFGLFETDKSNEAGMGLAISRAIIEDHGGRLWAETDAGAGAVLRFTLPTKQEETGVE